MLAIVITIMVLQLEAPKAEGIAALTGLWPVFLAYLLSYAYVGIYWVNHHRLFGHASRVTSRLLWSNMALLFSLSLVPFSTAYLGEHHFTKVATQLYLVTMLLPSLAYALLQWSIRATEHGGRSARVYHIATQRKGVAATLLYLAGLPLSFLSPWLGIACAALVAVFWIVPWGPLDRLFLPGED